MTTHKIEAIFFLGDLFEFWWGDDHDDDCYRAWEKFFKELDVDKYFICGNRDFLVGDDFSKKTNIKILSAGTVISYHNYKVALYHGDEDALIDPQYKRFKKFIRLPLLKKLWMLLPAKLRQRLSMNGRSYSRAPAELEYDYYQWINKLPGDITHIIHGHCHKEAIENFDNIKIITLGDWYADKTSIFCITPKSGQFL